MINIQDKISVRAALSRLNSNQKPVWGKMTPQHMVEHLILLFKVSINDHHLKTQTPSESLPALRKFLYSDKELKQGIKAPFLPDNLLPFIYPDFKSSVEMLLISLDEFFDYYTLNPGETAIHPVFGELDYKEWLMFHNKHFTHHFKQFELI